MTALQDINGVRVARLRGLIEQYGQGPLAKMLGYSHQSFLSHMAKDNPTRPITEKTARKFELLLGLPNGYMDTPDDGAEQRTAYENSAATVAEVMRPVVAAIHLVGAIQGDEKLALPPDKFAEVVALAYLDAMEHKQELRPDHVRRLVRLLK